MSLTYTEMKSQFEALRMTQTHIQSMWDELFKFFDRRDFMRIVYIGCGSSFAVAKSAAAMTLFQHGVEAYALSGGDVALNAARYEELFKSCIVVPLSRSGSTSEIIMAVNQLKTFYHTPVVSIVLASESNLETISDMTIALPFAFDESVCQTRSVSCLYAASLFLAAAMMNEREISTDVFDILEKGESFMEKWEPLCEKIAAIPWNRVVVLSDGEMSGMGEEAALAYKEICCLPSNHHNVLDVRHGPMVLLDSETLVVMAVSRPDLPFERDLVKDLSAKGCTVVVYTDEECSLGDENIHFGKPIPPHCRALVFLPVSQMISYYKAVNRGTNPDKPSGLDPWIKL